MQVAILGVGGNMGRRITRALRDDDNYKLRLIEPSERGQKLLAEMGLSVEGPIAVFRAPMSSSSLCRISLFATWP